MEVKGDILKIVESKVKRSIVLGITQEYADTLKNRIKQRTRLGVGVDPTTGASKKLDKLTTSYKRQRGRAKNLSSDTTPAKSNLTATGQLIDSLTVIKIKTMSALTYVFTLGDRRGRDLNGKSSKIGNKKLNEYVSILRPWLGFTKSQRNEIVREIRQIIIKYIK